MEEGGVAARAGQLIQARRVEALYHSLWSTFQRVQENAMRGGLSTVAASSAA